MYLTPAPSSQLCVESGPRHFFPSEQTADKSSTRCELTIYDLQRHRTQKPAEVIGRSLVLFVPPAMRLYRRKNSTTDVTALLPNLGTSSPYSAYREWATIDLPGVCSEVDPSRATGHKASCPQRVSFLKVSRPRRGLSVKVLRRHAALHADAVVRYLGGAT